MTDRHLRRFEGPGVIVGAGLKDRNAPALGPDRANKANTARGYRV